MRVAISLVLLLIGLPVLAASFDCDKATTATEKAICARPELSLLDEQLATFFFALYVNEEQALQEGHRQVQQDWLKQRDASCSGGDVACLTRMYEERIAALHNALRDQTAKTSDCGFYFVDPNRIILQEGEGWKEAISNDVLFARPVGTQLLSFSISSMGDNAHRCFVDGIASRDSKGNYRWKDSIAREQTNLDHKSCVIDLRPIDGYWYLEQGSESDCGYYCGLRSVIRATVYSNAAQLGKKDCSGMSFTQ
jgi:uncharacterized protein